MTMGPKDPDDRFGIPTERILEVIRAHDGLIRFGCYVPTRREVAEADAAWLWGILLDWWWESPSELIPTDGQVAEVLAILRTRPDAGSTNIQDIIAQAPPPEDGE
ncbi:MAG: hypothetical protein ACK4SZ_06905 [Allosphingosinicella sp.]|uniref:hypothetical protein n=1 Tax=Allosphingosinicella sp. TaxID=2823234 RepID=UPI00392CEEF5